MYKSTRMQYVIKSVPSDNTKALEDLLNEMSEQGWDLYSMHEVEADEGFQYNCIFASEYSSEAEEEEDVVNIKTFKSQMEKMLLSSASPYESCKEIQEKIKQHREKIAKIKTQLEESDAEALSAKRRKELNDEMSKGLKALDDLRQSLVKTISPEAMYTKIRQDKLTIHLSEEALDLVNPDLGGALISETVKVREKLTDELGYVLPKIIFEDDEDLNPYEFSIKIRGLNVLNAAVYPNYRMFFADTLKTSKKIKDAIYSIDEISGEKIVWIKEDKAKDFWQEGLAPAEFVARLLEWVVIKNIDDVLDYSDVNQYVEIVGQQNLFLIENIVPDFVSVAEIRYILASLLREGVSIKDIVYIFEKINDFAEESSKDDLLDKIRLSLSKQISRKVANASDVIQVLDLSEKTYKALFSKVKAEDNIVRIEGAKVEKIAKSVLKIAKSNEINTENIVILVPLEIRHMFYMVLSQFLSNIKVIAREEVSSDYAVEILDEI